jgi:hypothetical protein
MILELQTTLLIVYKDQSSIRLLKDYKMLEIKYKILIKLYHKLLTILPHEIGHHSLFNLLPNNLHSF